MILHHFQEDPEHPGTAESDRSSSLCAREHPFAAVGRCGHGYCCRGRTVRPASTRRAWHGASLRRAGTYLPPPHGPATNDAHDSPLDIAAGILYPVFGIVVSPIVGAAAMALSSVSVIANALRLARMRF